MVNDPPGNLPQNQIYPFFSCDSFIREYGRRRLQRGTWAQSCALHTCCLKFNTSSSRINFAFTNFETNMPYFYNVMYKNSANFGSVHTTSMPAATPFTRFLVLDI